MEAGTQGDTEGQAAPVLLRTGVTGRRRLPYQRLLRRRVWRVLRQLDRAPVRKAYRLLFESPLAERTDHLVAEETLAWSGTKQVGKAALEVVLPLPEENYVQDFATDAPKEEFRQLAAQARSVEVVQPLVSCPAAYDQVGRHVVDHRDARSSFGMESLFSSATEKTEDRAETTRLLEQANDVMLRENQDWRVVFGFQKLTL